MNALVTARRKARPLPRLGMAALAANPALDAAQLEQLIAADERLRDREARIEYASAFASMAAELPVIDEKGIIRHGDQVVGTYALWEDIHEAIRPILGRFGFALSFRIQDGKEDVLVSAVLTHSGGHSESASLRLAPDLTGEKNSVQAIGSSVSYGKRYTGSALLNLASRGEDDDARRAGRLITPAEVALIEARLKETGADQDRFLRYLKLEAIELIPEHRFDEAMTALQVRCPAPLDKGGRS